MIVDPDLKRKLEGLKRIFKARKRRGLPAVIRGRWM